MSNYPSSLKAQRDFFLYFGFIRKIKFSRIYIKNSILPCMCLAVFVTLLMYSLTGNPALP